ncbi:Rv0340 family IniB-related protein [Mycolicibacterium sp. GF69]|uniref:Rv0340 family IniB-related protein n=1 Tax=Mycolicibacterium sp. GF69 TaxID=2267251 RepID=UPI00197C081D|nr:Rv0340 family IniB-related protein [Mycolicibacterium sp. GF69]
MANELLDFVMSVVRDPDVAARFAADPEQAILDANLTNVTSADVHALIPVVSESISAPISALPTTVPSTGFDAGIAEAVPNVWSSGAATAAFDAFGDHVPAVVDDVSAALIADPTVSEMTDPGVPDVAGADDTSLQFDQPVIDDFAVDEAPMIEDLGDAVADVQQFDVPDVDAGGFDIFD